MIKNVVEYLVKNLVEAPNKVSIVLDESDTKIIVTVNVGDDDLKRVIGREGRIVRAIQAFIAAYHPNHHIDVVVNSIQQ